MLTPISIQWQKKTKVLKQVSIKQSIFDKDLKPSAILRIFDLLHCMEVRFGLHISHAIKVKLWMKCLRCHLKLTQNLIKYMPSFANMF